MRRFFPILLAVACLLSAAPSALAFGRIMYSDRPLNLRETRSPKAEWVGSLYAGQKVRVAHERDGWVAIYEPDATDPSESKAVGFSNAKYLVPTRGRYEPKEWGELVTTPTKLNIRSKPSVKGVKVRTLQPGERVVIDFPEDDWTLVFSPDATIRSRMNGIGYSSARFFEPVKNGPRPVAEPTREEAEEPDEVAAAPESPARAEPASQEIQRVAVTNEVNVYQSRTTGSPLVRTLRPGDVVQLGLLRNGWYAVFKASDMIRSESSSVGYALQSLMEENSRPEGVVASAAPAVSLDAIKAEAVKPESEQRMAVTPPPAPEPVTPAPAPRPEPTVQAAPAPAPDPAPTKDSGKQQTMVIDRSAFANAKRPDPTPDQNAHGYQFRFLEKSETREYGAVWITLKVFLATTKLPDNAALKDFASSLWKEHRRVTKNVLVEIYLPGMDTNDLAWGVIKFDYDGLLELWTRRATLFGTKFM